MERVREGRLAGVSRSTASGMRSRGTLASVAVSELVRQRKEKEENTRARERRGGKGPQLSPFQRGQAMCIYTSGADVILNKYATNECE